MILYTIVNQYDVLEAQNGISEPIYEKFNGGILEYRKGVDGKVLDRIHTTDLSVYLSGQYTI